VIMEQHRKAQEAKSINNSTTLSEKMGQRWAPMSEAENAARMKRANMGMHNLRQGTAHRQVPK
jgi:hypothetical protein